VEGPKEGLETVGTLQYDGVLVEFEDRLLAHLQIVIVQKIRRGESFLMSWRDAAETGDGHSAIWIHPAQNLYFKFAGSKVPAINTEWLEELTLSANSPRGLLVIREGTNVSDLSDADIASGKNVGKVNPAARVKATV
jgi:hypothetical protein